MAEKDSTYLLHKAAEDEKHTRAAAVLAPEVVEYDPEHRSPATATAARK